MWDIPGGAVLVFVRGACPEFGLVQNCGGAGCLGETETLSQGLCPVAPLLAGNPKHCGNLITDVKPGRSVFCLSGLEHVEG